MKLPRKRKIERKGIYAINLFLLLVFLCTILPPISAQNQQLYFEKFTSKDGLSENVVNTIFQDSHGFIWFGTNDGLNKFDGYEFSVFSPDTKQEGSINSNLIFTITEDHHQRLWVGTTGKGINYADLGTEWFKNLLHESNNKNSLSSNHIRTLFTDQLGRIWVVTSKGLDLIHFDKNNNPIVHRLKKNDHHDTYFARNFYEDKKGNIWVGSSNGLYQIPFSKAIDKIVLNPIKVDPKLDNSIIQMVKEDHQGRLIVGTDDGLYIQSNSNAAKGFSKFSNLTSISDLVEDEDHQIWVASYSGLHHFNNNPLGQTPKFVQQYTAALENPKGLGNNIIRCLSIDKNGLIWIGSNGEGVHYFDPKRKPFLSYGNKLYKNDENYRKIRSAYLDSNDYLWLGTEGGGLFHNQGKDYESFVSFESSDRPFMIEEINIGAKKMLWVGSEVTPFLRQIDISEGYPTTTKIIEGISSSTFAILQDKQQTIWIGTYGAGLYRLIPQPDGTIQKQQFLYAEDDPNSLSDDIIRKLFEDKHGNIWIGTGNGLNRISAASKQQKQLDFEIFKHHPNDSNSLSHNYILDIYESSTGPLWIGTLGGGLSKLEPSTNTFTTYNKENGLPNLSIKSILEDEQGHIWIASNKGLSQLNPESQNIKNYFSSIGLQGYEYLEGVALKKKDGALLFGGTNGFNVFYPKEIIDQINPPKVVFTDLEVLNKKITVGAQTNNRVILDKTLATTKEIELFYSENNFSIEFSGLDYAAANSMQYQYQLEGFDEQWIKTGANNRKATYTNLPPGTYILKVKAANQDGYWSETPATLNIKVIPPWYRTYTAFLGYGLIGLGLLYLYRRYELINIQEKHELVLEHINKEKREELNQLKLQFFTNISHELRTPLTLIIAPLEQLMQKGKTIAAEEVQQQYHFMYKNSKYLLRMVNQLLDFRKLDQGKMSLTARQGDIILFIKEIAEPFQFLARKQRINFSVNSEEIGLFIWFDPQFIEQILYNLLSNAFKFTPEGGSIEINLQEIKPTKSLLSKSKAKQFLEITVTDSGPGIPKKVAKKVFQRFFKEDGKQENKDGAGIGLAYTKSLVERHYGVINLQTAVGKGATFSVILPMDKAAFAKEETNKQPIQQFDKTADPLEYFMPEPINGIKQAKTTNIALATELPADDLPLLLFIDDNTDIRKFIQGGLENNFRVILAENGKVGYDMALSSLPDMIISDIMMPEMDGIELCKLLKANANTSHIPVVLLTAKIASESEMEGLQTGADAYVRKPFKLEVLKMQLLNIHRQREKLKDRFRKEIILQPSEVTVTSADEEFLQRAVGLVEEHMDDSEFNVEALVKEMYISRSKLYLKIKALTGQSSSEFIRTVRLKRAVQLLEASDYTIKEIMFMTGFNTASYFSKCFKQQFGMVPSEYMRSKAKI